MEKVTAPEEDVKVAEAYYLESYFDYGPPAKQLLGLGDEED
jgi:hypothetical protein